MTDVTADGGPRASLPGPGLGAVPAAPPVRSLVAVGIAACSIFVLGFGAWATFAPLSAAAVALGQIKIDGNRKTVQHLEGGIIREILVKEGDPVRQGQVLMRLSRIQPGAAFEALTAQQIALTAQDARLTAERSGAEEISFPPAWATQKDDPRIAEGIAGQEAIFHSLRAGYQGQVQILGQRQIELRAEIDGHRAQVHSLDQQLALINDELGGARELFAKGFTPRTRILALEREAAALEGTRGEQLGQIARSEQSISETEMQVVQLKRTRATDIATEQREVQEHLIEIGEKLRAAADVADRTEIVAPVTGQIVAMRYFTAGGVIRPGDPILDIVPSEAGLLVECRLRPADIPYVHPGQEAEVRLTAFKQRVVPMLHGHIVNVARDIQRDTPTGEPYYPTQIEIDAGELKRLENVHLVSGMPAQTSIPIADRTVLDYILGPIRDSYQRAMREP